MSQTATRKSFLKWCATLEWAWLMALPLPVYPSPDMAEPYFWQWIREIERYDGTWDLQFVRFTAVAVVKPLLEVNVLVGGLGSGEWKYWSLRWAAINRSNDLKGQKIWTSGSRSALAPVLNERFGEQQFRVDIQLGPWGYKRRDRYLKVDKDGMPFDLNLRKKIKPALRQMSGGASKYPREFFERKPSIWRTILPQDDPTAKKQK